MSVKRRRARPHRLKELRPAPGELRLVQDFLNSADLEAGTDELARPGGLADWLDGHSLLAAVEEIEAGDVQRAIEFRERFRTMVAAGEAATREMGAAAVCCPGPVKGPAAVSVRRVGPTTCRFTPGTGTEIGGITLVR